MISNFNPWHNLIDDGDETSPWLLVFMKIWFKKDKKSQNNNKKTLCTKQQQFHTLSFGLIFQPQSLPIEETASLVVSKTNTIN